MYGENNSWDEKIPTCVAAFDSLIDGGLPAGSLVLLYGEIGAGGQEFAYTSASKLSIVKTKPARRNSIIDPYYSNVEIPEKICYVSFTKSKEEVLREVYISFNEEYYEAFKKNLVFKDLSNLYFKHSIVPSNWSFSGANIFSKSSSEDEGELLEQFISFMEENAKGNLVIVDSITDLFVSSNLSEEHVFQLLKGLKSISKKWKGVVYMLLTRGVLSEQKERIVLDSMDGVLVFEWYRSKVHSWRKRYMYVDKFIGVLPHMAHAHIARFGLEVTDKSGLVVTNTERIF